MTESPKSAIVFAAGLGQRMLPLTEETPKPLLKVNDKPILGYALDMLAQHKIDRVVVNTHHLSTQVDDYINTHKHGLHTHLSHELELLETGGGLLKALPHLENDKPIFVINGDIIWLNGPKTPALKRLVDFWRDDMDALLLLHKSKDAFGYDGSGDFDITSNRQLKKTTSPSHPYVYTGIQILHPRLLKGMEIRPFSINLLYSKALQEDGTLKNMYGLVHDGEWLHIGTPEALNDANAYMKARPTNSENTGW
jgi:MurNAc alpha-1-phosphate uridylyltransferase